MAEQVGKFLTELPELETPTDGDLMYIVDDETTSKKVTMANLKRVLGGNVTGTVEDASVSFSDGADGIPMKECEVTIIPIQTGSGAPSPSNVRPISGHSSITVTVASTSGGSGEDTTVALGRTVYGGTLDVTTGVLTVTHTIVNVGSLSWTRTTDYNNPIFYAQITDKMNSSIDSICEWYANGGLITGPTTINALQNGYFGCGNNSKYIYVRDDQYTSVSDFTSATASVKFYYALAVPQTFTLTKEQIQTLLGQNYVSHDGGGNIKVVYIRDLDIVINDLINRVTALENE